MTKRAVENDNISSMQHVLLWRMLHLRDIMRAREEDRRTCFGSDICEEEEAVHLHHKRVSMRCLHLRLGIRVHTFDRTNLKPGPEKQVARVFNWREKDIIL